MDSQASQPNTPQAPSVGDQINSYISSLPSLVSASNQYSPQIAQQNTAITQQQAPQLTQLEQMLYPQLSNLQASNASFINQNETNGLPPALLKQYQDTFKSQVGDQNSAGIGANYVSNQTLAAQQAYASNYASLANSATGQLPLYNTQTASTQQPNIAAAYSPSSALQYGSSTYGSMVGGYASMYGANASITNNNNTLTQGYAKMGLQGAGAAFGG